MHAPTGATLRERMARRDSAWFIGRETELSVVEGLLVDDPAASIVLVHGPAGVGKSAFLREVARRAERRGWTPVMVDGQDLPPCPDALDEALAPARSAAQPLLLVDSYERMGALGLGPHLRRVLPTLPDRALVVVAGRAAPEAAWSEGGWEWLVRELPLGPLSPSDSRALLDAHGVVHDAEAAGLMRWSGGSPLVLALAAQADRDGRGVEAEVARTVVRRITEREDGNRHPDVLWVASLARTVTGPLLAEALPSAGRDALRWLASRTFARRRGAEVELDDLARWAVRCDLVAHHPERHRDLLRRLADSLHARGTSDGAVVLQGLAELALPTCGGGSCGEMIDALRPGDADRIEDGPTRDLVERAPELVTLARDPAGNIAGYSISVTPATAPRAAHDDPILGRWLRHAATLAPDGDAVLCRDIVGTSGARLLTTALGRSGLANPRYLYLPADIRLGDARQLPELGCRLLDCGEAGLLGRLRDLVYERIGLRPSPRPAADRTTGPGPGPGPTLEMRVLAPVVEVLVDGQATMTSDAQAKLLLALAARHPMPMHAEQVSELLWPGEPLAATRHRLHNLLLRLRKALGDRTAVTARRGGVLCLAPDRWSVDLWTFRQALADDGRNDKGEARRRALLLPRGNLAEVQFPYDDHFAGDRAWVRSEWLRHARSASTSDELLASDLVPALSALGLTPDDL